MPPAIARTVTLAGQLSGEDNRTMCQAVELRKALQKHCVGPYCADVNEFAFVLRVGGDMQEFDFEGCERLRFSRKSKRMTVDFGFPSRHWKGQTDEYVRSYLARVVEEGITCCLSRLEKDGIRVDSLQFVKDFEAAKAEFLASPSVCRNVPVK